MDRAFPLLSANGHPMTSSRGRRSPTRLRGSPYPRALGRALLAVARAQAARWDHALRRVEEEQERALARILAHAADTEFGRRHAFRAIHGSSDFAREVPVGDYDAFSPYIDRMRAGERGLVVPESIRFFGNSAGSSLLGKPKVLPISERQIAHQRRAGADVLMRHLAATGDDQYPCGFTLGLFPSTAMRAEGQVFVTSSPALMVARLPPMVAPAYLPHDEIERTSDYEKKVSAIAERYLDWDVRGVTGTTCWFALLFEKVIDAARRRGLDVSTMREIWPNLRALLGGGVSAAPYFPILSRLIGDDDYTLVDTNNATEGGIYAGGDHSGGPGMLVLPHRGTYFEFIPLDRRDRADAPRVPLWGVERDVLYSIAVTTCSGLYAYEIGDIVRFASTDPHRIEFVGRLAGCLSLTQELTTHVEIERAVAYAISRCPCRTLDFGAAADVGVDGSAKSRYVLFAEFDVASEPSSPEAFAVAFDAGLCKQNRVYREHRTADVAILPPIVVPLVQGGGRRFLNEITAGNVQGKFPRILDESRKAAVLAFTRRPNVN